MLGSRPELFRFLLVFIPLANVKAENHSGRDWGREWLLRKAFQEERHFTASQVFPLQFNEPLSFFMQNISTSVLSCRSPSWLYFLFSLGLGVISCRIYIKHIPQRLLMLQKHCIWFTSLLKPGNKTFTILYIHIYILYM